MMPLLCIMSNDLFRGEEIRHQCVTPVVATVHKKKRKVKLERFSQVARSSNSDLTETIGNQTQKEKPRSRNFMPTAQSLNEKTMKIMRLKKKKSLRKMTMQSSHPNLNTKKTSTFHKLLLVLEFKQKLDEMELSNRQSEELLLRKESSISRVKKSMLKKRLSLNERLVNEIEEKMNFMKKLS